MNQTRCLYLRIKERQFQEAISAALGLELSAMAEPNPKPSSDGGERGGGRGAVSTMTAPIPGQTFGVSTRLTNRGTVPIQLSSLNLVTTPGYAVTRVSGEASSLSQQQSATSFFTVAVADQAPISTKAYFSRGGLYRESLHAVRLIVFRTAVQSAAPRCGCQIQRERRRSRDDGSRPAPRAKPALRLRPPRSPDRAACRSDRLADDGGGSPVVSHAHGRSRRDGDAQRERANERPDCADAAAGWTSTPALHAFTFQRAGERSTYRFTITAETIDGQVRDVAAVATVAGQQYREGYELVEARDLETRYLYRPAIAKVRGVDVQVVPDLNVG